MNYKLSSNYTNQDTTAYSQLFLQYLGVISNTPLVVFSWLNLFIKTQGYLYTTHPCNAFDLVTRTLQSKLRPKDINLDCNRSWPLSTNNSSSNGGYSWLAWTIFCNYNANSLSFKLYGLILINKSVLKFI